MPSASPAPHVLVVEDDTQLGPSLARWLGRRGFACTLETTGEDGVKALSESPFDLVLLDLELPGMHGHAVLRQLARTSGPPTIVMSGTGTMDDVIEAVRNRACDYVRKPFHSEDLLSAIDRALALKNDRAARADASSLSGESSSPSVPSPSVEQRERGRVGRRMAQVAVDLTRGKLKLPVLDPRVRALMAKMSGSNDPSVRDVVAEVRHDATAVAAILRTANSPLYRRRAGQSDRLEDACVRLGNRQVLALLTELLVADSLRCREEPFASLGEALRTNAAATAQIARHLAPAARLDPDEAHLAALLHDLGELVLLRLLAEREWDRPPSAEALGHELVHSHERFGGIVARAWSLPDTIVRLAARHHRKPIEPESPSRARLRRLVVGSWALAIDAGFTYPGAGPKDEREQLRSLGIPSPLIAEASRAAVACREGDL